MVRRKGAQPGDFVVVTGTIGDAALGLLLRQEARRETPGDPGALWRLDAPMREHLLDRYMLPRPAPR